MKPSQGLTLIELMVTLLLGSFIALGLISLFANNVQTANITQDLGVSTEGAGVGSLLMNQYLRLAGYTNYFEPRTLVRSVRRVSIAQTSNNDGVNGSDRLTIEHEAPTNTANYTTCGGLVVAPGTLVQERFQVNALNELECRSRLPITNETQRASLIPNVRMFQVQYGIANTTFDIDVGAYVNADALPDQENTRNRIRAIRYKILVSGDQAPANAQMNNFPLFDVAVPNILSDASYRVYGTTITLNNSLRGRIIQ